ncbi:MAG TPA: hypothetical protein VKD90_18455 [Gemmataceae bacterium]|nr:hypothetical protein [Gemmataceae bacterium]
MHLCYNTVGNGLVHILTPGEGQRMPGGAAVSDRQEHERSSRDMRAGFRIRCIAIG